MKKTAAVILAMMLFGAFAFTGCKKDYACDCTVSGVAYHYDYAKQKKKTAQSTCDAQQAQYKLIDPAATCTLK
jgi:hypothetical protein